MVDEFAKEQSDTAMTPSESGRASEHSVPGKATRHDSRRVMACQAIQDWLEANPSGRTEDLMLI